MREMQTFGDSAVEEVFGKKIDQPDEVIRR